MEYVRHTQGTLPAWKHAGWVVAFLFCAEWSVPPALGDLRPGFTVVELVVDQEIFERISKRLALSEEQRKFAESAFERYSARIKEHDRVSRERIDAAGWAEFSRLSKEARTVGHAPQWDRMTELMHQYHPVSANALVIGDRILAEFLAEIEPILIDAQRDLFPYIMPMIRRATSIRPPSSSDDGGNADLYLALQDASREIDGLAWLDVEAVSDDWDPAIEQARRDLALIVKDYEAALDRPLVESTQFWRRPLPAEATVQFSDESDWGRKRIQAGADLWVRLHRTTDQSQQRVRELVRSVSGDDLAAQWSDFWKKRAYPGLAAERLPDRVIVWLNAREDFTDEQRDSVMPILADYRISRDALIDSMAGDLVRIKEEATSPSRRDKAVESLNKRKTALITHIDQTIQAMRSLLTPEQSASLDAHIRGLLSGWPRLQGPSVPANTPSR